MFCSSSSTPGGATYSALSSVPSSPSALTFHGAHFTHETSYRVLFVCFFYPAPRIPQKGATGSLTCSFRFARPWFHYYHNSFSSVKEVFTPRHTEPRLPEKPPDLLNISVGGGWIVQKKNCPQTAVRQMWYLCRPMRCRLSPPYRRDLIRAKQSGRGAEELITESLSHMLAFHHRR